MLTKFSGTWESKGRWITNEGLVKRLHAASITSQWSASLASWSHRLTRWVLDGPQISLIGLCGSTPYPSPPQPRSASSLVEQNVFNLQLAQLQTGMSGEGAVNTTRAQWNSGRLPMLQQSNTETETHKHTCGAGLTPSATQSSSALSNTSEITCAMLIQLMFCTEILHL